MKLAAIFKDGMVLQQNRINRIWGTADDGEEINVLFREKKYVTTCDNGEWFVDIEELSFGGPFEMTVTNSIGDKYVISDILIGEVWLAGGQSNMELELQNSDDGQEVCRNADNDNIRFYNVPKYAKNDEGVLDLEDSTCWKIADNPEIADVSAVAYYFATKLYDELQVPIGIIDCYWGGTSATCWFSREKADEIPEVSDYIRQWDEVIESKSDVQYRKEMDEYNEEYNAWNNRVEELRLVNPSITWEEINEKAGLCPWPQPMGAESPFRPFGLYECMVKRVSPYGIKGFIYYQAEEDWSRGEYYDKLNDAVIKEWRECFSIGDYNDYPFIITQLPMYIAKGDEDIHNFAKLREAQERCFRFGNASGMAVLIDCGEFDNIHPTDKKTPGERLALQALGRVYKLVRRYDNMYIKSVIYDKDCLILSFDNSYGEIIVRYIDDDTLTAKNDKVERNGGGAFSGKILGFEISEDGKKFYKAEVTVIGEQIKVLYNGIVKKPIEIRYAYMDYGVANVYNAAGLPLAPFRAIVDNK